MRYDPNVQPDPEEWLATGEAERVEAVRVHHQRAKLKSGNQVVHATIHSAVETQLAEGHPHAAAALARLLAEGLDRHEAIHAIGSVLTEEIFGILKSKRAHDAVAYARRLDKLTAAGWRGGS
jgi:Domain of unknown function (DUF1841)